MKFPKPRIFTPVNPEKYVGDANNIVARSNLERRFFKYIDENSGIVKWGSEEFNIKYFSPVDQKIHRYFVDLVIQTKDKKVYLVEIKPHSQTTPPKKRKNTKTYLYECKQWVVNDAKWKAAREFCKKYNMEFIILTEKDLKNA